MSATPPAHRVELSPAVRAVLDSDGPKSALLKHFVRYLEALIAQDPAGLDGTVTPDARSHELEAIGLPPGRDGLKLFRRKVNAAIPDEHIVITAVSFEGAGVAVLSERAVRKEVRAGRLRAGPVAGITLGRDIFVVRDRERVLPPAHIFLNFIGPRSAPDAG